MISSKMIFLYWYHGSVWIDFEYFFNLTDFYSKRRNHKTKYKRLLTDAEKLKSGKVLGMSECDRPLYISHRPATSLQSEEK